MLIGSQYSSSYLTERQEHYESRIKNGNMLFQAYPERKTRKTEAVLKELEYRKQAIDEAILMLSSFPTMDAYKAHTCCAQLYRKYMVSDPEFAAFVRNDKSKEATQAQEMLVSVIDVFSPDFNYADEKNTSCCFVQYAEEIVRYFLGFREKYSSVARKKHN